MGTEQEMTRGWDRSGWEQATSLEPSVLSQPPPWVPGPQAARQHDQPLSCLPSFLWTHLVQIPQGVQPLERRKGGVRCWPQQGAQGPGQPSPLASWNQRALNSNAATPADSMHVGVSLFTLLRLSFPT